MNLNRKDSSGARGTKSTLLTEICLDLFEKADDFCEGITCETEIVPGLTLRLLIDALVASEQQTVSFFDEQ